MAKRQEDSTTTLVGVMIKIKTLKSVSYGLGISMFTGEECSWGLYHLEVISTQFDNLVKVRILC